MKHVRPLVLTKNTHVRPVVLTPNTATMKAPKPKSASAVVKPALKQAQKEAKHAGHKPKAGGARAFLSGATGGKSTMTRVSIPDAAPAGSFRAPKIMNNVINIMWSNASFTPADMAPRLAKLKKWLEQNVSPDWTDCYLDVSGNKMGEKAVGELIGILIAAKVAVRVLKCFQMDLGDSVTPHIVKLFRAQKAKPLRELHLSHNKLTRGGASTLILGAGSSGCYPTKHRGAMSPLWLRLERNPITRMDEIYETATKKGWTICTESKPTCPCKHKPTCMIAVPAFSSSSMTISETETKTESKLTPITYNEYTPKEVPPPALNRLPAKTGEAPVLRFPGAGGKPQVRALTPIGSLARKGQATAPAAKGNDRSASTGSKASGKGKKGFKNANEGPPVDGETKRRGKEVYKLLNDMAKSKVLIQSWLPDWGKASDYQRMEWFGDKILGHLLTERIWSIFDNTSEGFLTQFHQQATCNKTLAYIFEFADVGKIMDMMNVTPSSKRPLIQFHTGKELVKRRGDAIEVIFGDLTTRSTKYEAGSSEAKKISTCLQLLSDLCVRCAEYCFGMEFNTKSSRPKTLKKIQTSVDSPQQITVEPKASIGIPVSKASQLRPKGMTIAIAAAPERYAQGDTIRPIVGEKITIKMQKYTECELLQLQGWLHLPAVDPLIRKFDKWASQLPASVEYDFVMGRTELSLLALTPFAPSISWTMKIDHRDNKTRITARSLCDITSKDAKKTAMTVSKIDIGKTREFPTSGVQVSLGKVKFFVVMDGCDFRDQYGNEMDLAVGVEDKETMRQWWTKTLFIPQVVGVITAPMEEKEADQDVDEMHRMDDVQRIEVYPQQELANTLDRKVSFGFMLDVLNAIKTIIGNKTTAAAMVDCIRDSGEVRVFEIGPEKVPRPPLQNKLVAKAPSVQPSPAPSEDFEVEEDLQPEPEEELSAIDGEEDDDEELEFDGAELESHARFLEKLKQISEELEFEDDTADMATSEPQSEAEGDTRFSEFSDVDDVEFDDGTGSVGLVEGELDFDGGDTVFDADDEKSVQFDDALDDAVVEAEQDPISEDDLLMDGDTDDTAQGEIDFEVEIDRKRQRTSSPRRTVCPRRDAFNGSTSPELDLNETISVGDMSPNGHIIELDDDDEIDCELAEEGGDEEPEDDLAFD